MYGLNAREVARVAHEANRGLQLVTGDPAPSPAWEDAPARQQESVVDGVRAAMAGASPEELHEAWMAGKAADGWTYGPVKDPTAKTHPCMVPYGDLPKSERAKDVLFHAVVGALTGATK